MSGVPKGYKFLKSFKKKSFASAIRKRMKAKGWKVRLIPNVKHAGTTIMTNYDLYICTNK